MITIDGSHGEGGGQIVRSSLALSLVTGQAVRIENIRAGRQKPGLRRQHLTAVEAARRVSDADVSDVEIGSTRLEFRPGKIRPGEYRFAIGTAGSTTLVLQTVLPPLMLADAPSHLVLEGGTHNPLAPPYDFLARAYLPLICRLGPKVVAQSCQPGFYPAGGGRFEVSIQPSPELRAFELLERGELVGREVCALVANLPRHIADRECATIRKRTNWDPKCFVTREVENSPGPGNVVMIALRFEHVTEVFTGYGQRGKRAEQVAGDVLRAAREYLSSSAPVGPHLADQLVLPLGISAYRGHGGGIFHTYKLSQHAETHLWLLRQMLDIEPVVTDHEDRTVEVRIS